MSEEKLEGIAREIVTRFSDVIKPQFYQGVTAAIEDALRAQAAYVSRLEAALSAIRETVDAQAEDEALWAVPALGTQPIAEAYLQQELRNLHTVIETALNAVEVFSLLSRDDARANDCAPRPEIFK